MSQPNRARDLLQSAVDRQKQVRDAAREEAQRLTKEREDGRPAEMEPEAGP